MPQNYTTEPIKPITLRACGQTFELDPRTPPVDLNQATLQALDQGGFVFDLMQDRWVRNTIEDVTHSTGSLRSDPTGKGRPDLVPQEVVHLLSLYYEELTGRYDEWNWAKGQPYTRVWGGVTRHLGKWLLGMKDEGFVEGAFGDLKLRVNKHLVAALWGVVALIYYVIHKQQLPNEIDDRHNRVTP